MKSLRHPSPRRAPVSASEQRGPRASVSPSSLQLFKAVILSICQAYVLIFLLFLLLPLAAAAQSMQHQWAGNWLVVGESDEQLVWQLHADGTGFAYGFQPSGRLSHGFAISWQLRGNRVQVRTGASLRCDGGVVAVAFTGWSPVTLNFDIVDGRHWYEENGNLLSFQRRLQSWKTPKAGSECPSLAGS